LPVRYGVEAAGRAAPRPGSTVLTGLTSGYISYTPEPTPESQPVSLSVLDFATGFEKR